ncbi:MAG: hypothetical protein HYX69_09795 [Planctomycetia bacterium]|nr:hypothetical protein [Planctomycetia bacterium]
MHLSLGTRVLLALVVVVVVLFALGMITLRRHPGETDITIHTGKMKEAAQEAAEETRQAVDKAADAIRAERPPAVKPGPDSGERKSGVDGKQPPLPEGGAQSDRPPERPVPIPARTPGLPRGRKAAVSRLANDR